MSRVTYCPKNNEDHLLHAGMKTLYCISGLGADQRIFSELAVPGMTLIPLQWILPLQDESIGAYAARMLQQVPGSAGLPAKIPGEGIGDMDAKDAMSVRPCFLGVSFGGMMAIEMARLCPGAEVILVSSVKSRRELPLWMRLAGSLRLNRLMPLRPPRWPWMEDKILGTTNVKERDLVNEFRKTADPHYIRWAIAQVLNWRNEWRPPVCYHIHGNRDRTFPIRRIRPTHVVQGGGHFMIFSQAKEMNEILLKIR